MPGTFRNCFLQKRLFKKMVHISIVFANLILQQQCFELKDQPFSLVNIFLCYLSISTLFWNTVLMPLLLLLYCYYPGPSRRTPYFPRRSSHPVWQPAHPSCYLQHHSWRRAAPRHRHYSPTGLQTEVTWEWPHTEAPADADGQSRVPRGSGMQRGWVRLIRQIKLS